jgi:ABC-type transporter Mla subunit MlaD
MSRVTVEINGRETVSDASEKARKSLHSLSDETKSTSSTTDALSDKTKLLQDVFNGFVVTAVVTGLKKITEAAFDCYQEFGEMDRRMQQLKIALGNNEESFNRNVDLIDSLAKKTLASKDDIESLIAELASLGKSDDDIERIATAAVNLSNVTGKDLNTAFMLINATYAGTAGRLAQLLPEIKNFSKEQLASGDAVDLVNTKFGTLSDELAENNIPQKIKNLKDRFNDLKETLGGLVAPLFDPLLDYLDKALTGWKDLGNAIESTSKKFNDMVDSPQATQAAITTLQNLIAIETSKLNDYSRRIADAQAKAKGGSSPELEALKAERTKLGEIISGYLAQLNDLLSGKKPSEVFKPAKGNITSPSSGNSETDKILKTNYKTVENIYKDITQVIGIMKNHPDYFSFDEIKSFVKSIRGRIYGAELLQLGPEGTALLDDTRTLLQVLSTQIPEASETSGASNALSVADQAWADRYTKQAEAYFAALPPPSLANEALSVADQAWADRYIKMAEAYFAALPPPSLANGALSVADQAWADRYTKMAEAYFAALPPPSLANGALSAADQAWSDRYTKMAEAWIEEEKKRTAKYKNEEFINQSTVNAYAMQAGIVGHYVDVKDEKGNKSTSLQGGTELGNLLAGFETIASTIRGMIGPIINVITSLESVEAILNPVTTIFQSMMDVLGPLVNTILAPFVGILRTIGTFLGTILAPILNVLSPVVTALATAFVWFYNNVMLPVGNAIIMVGNWMYNAVAKVVNTLLGWLGVHLNTVEITSGTLSKISLSDLSSAGSTSYYGNSNGTSGSTASYTKQRDINVYVTLNTDALVGDDGIREFALIIGRELKSAGVLGVS